MSLKPTPCVEITVVRLRNIADYTATPGMLAIIDQVSHDNRLVGVRWIRDAQEEPSRSAPIDMDHLEIIGNVLVPLA